MTLPVLFLNVAGHSVFCYNIVSPNDLRTECAVGSRWIKTEDLSLVKLVWSARTSERISKATPVHFDRVSLVLRPEPLVYQVS